MDLHSALDKVPTPANSVFDVSWMCFIPLRFCSLSQKHVSLHLLVQSPLLLEDKPKPCLLETYLVYPTLLCVSAHTCNSLQTHNMGCCTVNIRCSQKNLPGPPDPWGQKPCLCSISKASPRISICCMNDLKRNLLIPTVEIGETMATATSLVNILDHFPTCILVVRVNFVSTSSWNCLPTLKTSPARWFCKLTVPTPKFSSSKSSVTSYFSFLATSWL